MPLGIASRNIAKQPPPGPAAQARGRLPAERALPAADWACWGAGLEGASYPSQVSATRNGAARVLLDE
jgi:hypothetical protein